MRVIRGILSLICITVFVAHLVIAIVPARAASPAGIVISEVSMGSEDSASDEFVELYNNSPVDINLNGWGMYYKSSTGKTWTKRASFAQNTVVHAHDYFLLASSRADADLTMTAGMSQTSGVIQIKDNNDTTIDLIGWGSADTYEAQASASPQAGEVLYRQFDTVSQTMQDTDNNFDDLNISANETPKAPPVVEVPTADITQTYPKIVLNELLPNPASPQEDTSDEFIELYNPNSQPVDMSGWILKDAGGASYIIKDKAIPGLGYLVITSAESSLSLNNTGDIIYLYSPDNTVVDVSADYGDAKEGLSWAVVGDSWDWTISPTPGSANSTAYVELDTSKPASASKTTAAKKAVSATKKTAAKTTSSKVTAKPKATSSNDKSSQDQAQGSSGNTNSLVWSWLLIALGVGTIGYGIYEYRPEIIGAYHRLANKFKARS
jgi:hypothetical protein